MATYRTAPNLGKPPHPSTLTKRHRRASRLAVEATRRAAAGRRFGTAADLERQARAEAKRTAVFAGPHPLPVERVDLAQLTGSAKSLAKWGAEVPLDVQAATTGREVEVRIGRDGVALGRALFREGRLVHAFALVGGQYVKRTITALKAELADTMRS